MKTPRIEELRTVYGDDAPRHVLRYEALVTGFKKHFGVPSRDVSYFSVPGRTEIIGNHTDHNGGKILAASITMDSICVAAPTDSHLVRIVSEGYDEPIIVDLARLEEVEPGPGSTTLVAGMMVYLKQQRYLLGGFDASVTSEVIPSAGVSSSASFEMLIATVVSHLFNEAGIDVDQGARAGQFAENHYWRKSSGLMDQMACGVGGSIILDFSDGVAYRKVDFGFDQLGYELVIVQTGEGHADLSAEYSAIPDEMHEVARALGVEQLCQTSEDTLLELLPSVRTELGSDRALLRALHFFEECRRVDEASHALEAGAPERVLELIRESGNSSWKWLQNAVVPGSASEQPVPVALALTELFLTRLGAGVCRIHGGGFAGVIACVLPQNKVTDYVAFIERFMGAGSAHPMGIRQVGAVRVA